MPNAQTLTNFIGAKLLPFMNPRVVCPPGLPVAQGRPNILVATPKRSGTHVLIDLLLNNIPAYRNTPLYIDLDQCWKQGRGQQDLLGRIAPDMGYVIKTHYPVGLPATAGDDERLQDIVAQSVAVTVRRNHADVARSMARWTGANTRGSADYETEYTTFWAFWQTRPQIEVAFETLFDPQNMAPVLDKICQQTGTHRAERFLSPPDARGRRRIYMHKALTRLAGRRAPRIDTTIHTLKR